MFLPPIELPAWKCFKCNDNHGAGVKYCPQNPDSHHPIIAGQILENYLRIQQKEVKQDKEARFFSVEVKLDRLDPRAGCWVIFTSFGAAFSFAKLEDFNLPKITRHFLGRIFDHPTLFDSSLGKEADKFNCYNVVLFSLEEANIMANRIISLASSSTAASSLPISTATSLLGHQSGFLAISPVTSSSTLQPSIVRVPQSLLPPKPLSLQKRPRMDPIENPWNLQQCSSFELTLAAVAVLLTSLAFLLHPCFAD
jgi:hypothetical protein